MRDRSKVTSDAVTPDHMSFAAGVEFANFGYCMNTKGQLYNMYTYTYKYMCDMGYSNTIFHQNTIQMLRVGKNQTYNADQVSHAIFYFHHIHQ